MQFNRQKYLEDDYDSSIYQESRARYKASQIKGLEWNMYIKDYVLFCMRSDLISADVEDIKPIFQYIPLIELGMFNTVADIISTEKHYTDKLVSFCNRWVPLLRSANDIDPLDKD